MSAPMPYREFEALVKSYGCVIELTGSHGVIRKDGKYVARFAITHGKRTKRHEVKQVYVRKFKQAIGAQWP